MRFSCLIGLISSLFVLVGAPTAPAQLRIVSYNTLKNPTTSGDAANWNIALQAIGNESVGGIAKRIGIMALQEADQQTAGQNAKNIASQLNTLYGVNTYQTVLSTFGDGFNLQGLVYDSSQVQLLGTLSTDIGTRATLRGKFRPVGYTSPESEFYVYSSHLKAFANEQAIRANEAILLRNNGNNLGQGANIIYAGDFNLIGGTSEAAYNTMLAAGNGQAIDPENGDFTTLLKKTYSSTSAVSRLDFQFITNELADDEGLDLIDGSYRAFGRVQRTPTSVITAPAALESASDHLPVVADYQLPAMMLAELAAVPTTLLQGTPFNLDLSVSNVASVVAALGADELDYSLSLVGSFGTLLGEASGIDAALGAANLHQVALDTSTPGIKSGMIQVASTSPGVANGLFSFNVMFEVLAAVLAGDYNDDGTIDAADYTVWRDALDSPGAELLNDPTPGTIDASDYAYWRDHFGQSLPGGSASGPTAVPEPATLLMLLLGIGLAVPTRFRHSQLQFARPGRCVGIAAGLLITALTCHSVHAAGLRIATYNVSLSPDEATGEKSLPQVLASPGDPRAQRVAEVIQRIDPDILLINEFNWDANGAAADSFVANYLAVGHDAAATGTSSKPISFPYRYLPTGPTSPFNTGIASGMDLDGNGQTTDAGDALGYGKFPGQYGMIVLSKYPIALEKVRTFQQFRWRDMPDNLLPTEYFSPAAQQALRLSSKSHWDIPIEVDGQTIHVLASHPTPPVFDGSEDRNGRRNFDEIRFWRDYVTPGDGNYIYDDAEFATAGNATPAKPSGGLSPGATFVVLGDQNADPADGGSRTGAINQLLKSPRVNASLTPSSSGGPPAATLHGDKNTSHASDPAHDTAAFGPSGNLRVDYVLPSADLNLRSGHVFWFTDGEPLFALMTHDSFPSDHRAVYIDVELAPAGSQDSARLSGDQRSNAK